VLNANNEAVGKIVRSVAAPNGGYDVLSEIRLESIEAGNLLVNDAQLQIQQQPYELIATEL
jgi:hypothetical protein